MTIKTSGTRFGAWMTDPLASSKNNRVSCVGTAIHHAPVVVILRRLVHTLGKGSGGMIYTHTSISAVGSHEHQITIAVGVPE